MSKSYGKALKIDLSTRKIVSRGEDVICEFIGGKGFAAKVYDELKPGTNPPASDNILVVAAGSVTGTNARSFFKAYLPLNLL